MSDTKIDNSGAAFPTAVPETFKVAYASMSLRDWFAGQALAGMIARSDLIIKKEDTDKRLAHSAYIMADAMLAERSK